MAIPNRAEAREKLNLMVFDENFEDIKKYLKLHNISHSFSSQLKLENFCNKKFNLENKFHFKLYDTMLKNCVGTQIVSMYNKEDLYKYFAKLSMKDFIEVANTTYQNKYFTTIYHSAIIITFIEKYFKEYKEFSHKIIADAIVWSNISHYSEQIIYLVNNCGFKNNCEHNNFPKKLSEIVFEYPDKINIIDPYLDELNQYALYNILYTIPEYVTKINPAQISLELWESLLCGRHHNKGWYCDNDGKTFKLPTEKLKHLIQYCDKWVLLRPEIRQRCESQGIIPNIIVEPIFPITHDTKIEKGYLSREEEIKYIYSHRNNNELLLEYIQNISSTNLFRLIQTIEDKELQIKLLRQIEQQILNGEFK